MQIDIWWKIVNENWNISDFMDAGDYAWVFWDLVWPTCSLLICTTMRPASLTELSLGWSSLGAHSYLRLSSMHLSACIDSCSPNGLFGTLEAEKMSHDTFNPFANVCRQYITIKVYWHTMQWSYDKELSHNLWNVIQANFYSIKAPSSISVIIGWVTNINLNWNSLFSIQQMIDAYIIFYA